ncbi:XRE family transcriptional regulator [Peptoniphilus sp. AGMB00490]|uniref:XRE family transcriptional regulator n=1 Tax=Peptoniphilus faecalis TaxID=2731255 RepID=A0A848RJ29_9FIRM|nr:XRE family transcriptional regulator [Peptoniphilus faecalis]MDD6906314.1 XRE family transcriptional regulator [Finegoldia magna]NMW85453.1 XRE family transcriptional regulator [Peptoniphilus faecalis]
MVNVDKLKGKIVESNLNISSLAKKLDVNQATLYRKINNYGVNFTVKEIEIIGMTLNLTLEEMNEIFFKDYVAYNAKKTKNKERSSNENKDK